MEQVDELASAASERLRAAGIRLSIIRRSRQLCLRGTLPARSEHGKPHQQTLTLGIDATPIGVQLAEGRAHQIFLDIQVGRFKWSDYLRERVNRQTVREWAQLAEREYWVRRGGKTLKSEGTWQVNYIQWFKRLGLDNILTPELVRRFLDSLVGSPTNLNSARMAVRYLCQVAEVDVDWTRWERVRRKGPKERVLPTDEEIIAVWETIQPRGTDKRFNRQWPWVYGMIATYGLRPHEAWLVDLETLRASGGESARIGDGKTGSRWIYAYPFEWVERFNLLEGEPPQFDKCRLNIDYGKRAGIWAKKIPFALYDLRHAYAVRMIRDPNIKTEIAARAMGHSVAVHTKTYQKWMDESQVGSIMRGANQRLCHGV